MRKTSLIDVNDVKYNFPLGLIKTLQFHRQIHVHTGRHEYILSNMESSLKLLACVDGYLS